MRNKCLRVCLINGERLRVVHDAGVQALQTQGLDSPGTSWKGMTQHRKGGERTADKASAPALSSSRHVGKRVLVPTNLLAPDYGHHHLCEWSLSVEQY